MNVKNTQAKLRSGLSEISSLADRAWKKNETGDFEAIAVLADRMAQTALSIEREASTQAWKIKMDVLEGAR